MALGTEFTRNFCAGISPLQLGVVLVLLIQVKYCSIMQMLTGVLQRLTANMSIQGNTTAVRMVCLRLFVCVFKIICIITPSVFASLLLEIKHE